MLGVPVGGATAGISDCKAAGSIATGAGVAAAGLEGSSNGSPGAGIAKIPSGTLVVVATGGISLSPNGSSCAGAVFSVSGTRALGEFAWADGLSSGWSRGNAAASSCSTAAGAASALIWP